MNTTISFPGLGIEEFTVSRVALSLTDDWKIYWYGVIIMLGVIVAAIHAYLRTRQEGITADDIMDVGIWTVLCGVVGARLYYVIFDYIDRPQNYKSFKDFIAVWEGGLAIYGGIIAGTLAILIVTRIKKINTLQVMDTVAPGVMIAQAIGRWGNFFNGEAHGGVVPENSPLYFLRMGLYENGRMQYFHPTFLYESLWNIVGFTLITIFYRKKKFNGQVTLAYFAWYGFGRMFIEALRTDSLWLIPGVVRVSQLIGGICFIAGVGLMILCLSLVKKGIGTQWLAVQWASSVPVEGVCEDEIVETAETAETAEAAEAAETAETAETDERESDTSIETIPADADSSSGASTDIE